MYSYLKLITVLICLLVAPNIFGAPTIKVERFETNPLITRSTPHAGSNICGPSVIRVPEWVSNPLGRYYLYFARHRSSSMEGAYIRLAYADSPEGPWTVHQPGTLKRSALKDLIAPTKPVRKKQHIASPDVHVDHKNRRIILYFHGSYYGHNTGVAVSADGLHFEDQDVNLGPAYFRMFNHNGKVLGIRMGLPGPESVKTGRSAMLQEFAGPFGPATGDPQPLIPAIGAEFPRHLAVLKRGDRLFVFYSRTGGKPERIQASTVDLSVSGWTNWRSSDPIEVIRPEFPYEGSDRPLTPSKAGTAGGVNQLRDPCVFVDDDGRMYLYYCIQGEAGIAGARLQIRD
jgi:hypothetical protein